MEPKGRSPKGAVFLLLCPLNQRITLDLRRKSTYNNPMGDYLPAGADIIMIWSGEVD